MGNYSATHYQSQTAGPISVPTTYNGAVLAIGMSLAAYTASSNMFTDDSGVSRAAADVTDIWGQEVLSASAPSMVAYRAVEAGSGISNQTVILANASFKTQLLVHFYRS